MLNIRGLRAGVAQLVEQRIRNARVVGSSPISGTMFFLGLFDVSGGGDLWRCTGECAYNMRPRSRLVAPQMAVPSRHARHPGMSAFEVDPIPRQIANFCHAQAGKD
jgi:hypothetical protein